jgi:cytochrome P450 family 9
MRATLSPMFTGSKMRMMYSHVSIVGKQTADTIKEQILLGEDYKVEFKDFAMKFTVDVSFFRRNINS